MSKLNIAAQVETLLYNYVRTLVRGQAFELVCSDVGLYDIVVKLSEDEELVIGEVYLDLDFDVFVEFFDEDETLDD